MSSQTKPITACKVHANNILINQVSYVFANLLDLVVPVVVSQLDVLLEAAHLLVLRHRSIGATAVRLRRGQRV